MKLKVGNKVIVTTGNDAAVYEIKGIEKKGKDIYYQLIDGYGMQRRVYGFKYLKRLEVK